GFKVHAIHPAIDIPFAREAAALPLRQFLVPTLFQPADRRWGEPGRLWSYEGLQRLGEIPGRDTFEVEPGQQRLQAFRPPNIRWQERRVKAHPAAAAIPPPGDFDAHRPNSGLHLTLRQGAMPDHRLAALGIMTVGILG